MNDEKEELHDFVGRSDDNMVIHIFGVNKDGKNQYIRVYTPEQAEQIAQALKNTAHEIKNLIAKA